MKYAENNNKRAEISKVILYKHQDAKSQFSAREFPKEIIPGVTKLSELIFSKGSLEVRYYEPGSRDLQVPHEKEELYFIISGSAYLESPERSFLCEIGDAVFVPKNATHKFIEASEDFAVWVVYFDA